MNKIRTLLIIGITILLCSNLLAQDNILKKSPGQISFVYPIGTSGLESKNTQYNFSLNALIGAVGGIKGCEVGGIANLSKGNITGLQVGGIINTSKKATGAQIGGIANISKQTQGIQVAGILNLCTGQSSGIQTGGIGNLTKQDVIGLQIGGIFNTSKNIKGLQVGGIINTSKQTQGLQVAGILNLCSGQFSGIQTGGIGNLTKQDATGIQVGGIFNTSKKIQGLQVGGILNLSTEAKGVQIAGIVNKTKKLNGFQLSLINIADTVESGISLGLINIYKKGAYKEFEISFANYCNIRLSYKYGLKRFYTIYSAGTNFISDKLWIAGIGFGHIQKINSIFSFQPEIISLSYFPQSFNNVKFTEATHLKLGLTCDLSPKIALSFAPSIYAMHQSIETKYDINLMSPFFEHNGNKEKTELGINLCLALIIK